MCILIVYFIRIVYPRFAKYISHSYNSLILNEQSSINIFLIIKIWINVYLINEISNSPLKLSHEGELMVKYQIKIQKLNLSLSPG